MTPIEEGKLTIDLLQEAGEAGSFVRIRHKTPDDPISGSGSVSIQPPNSDFPEVIAHAAVREDPYGASQLSQLFGIDAYSRDGVVLRRMARKLRGVGLGLVVYGDYGGDQHPKEYKKVFMVLPKPRRRA